MTVYNQQAPFAIQIELSEGCNLRCSFCGLQGIRKEGEKNYKFMDEATIRKLGKEANKWGSRLELAMHGEPSMHPDFVGMIRALRESAPRCQIMMTSNGGGFLRDIEGTIQRVLDAGLDILALDNYDGIKIVDKIREKLRTTDMFPGVRVYEYPTESDGNPHRRPPKKMLPFITLIRDPSLESSGKTPSLSNHCGAAFPPNDKQAGRRCAKPFREMSIRWDGNVALCCNDWRGYYKCGNILEQTLEEVWNSPAFDAARRRLYNGDRDFGACKGCDQTSYRVGLLPDAKGLDEMPYPNAESEAAMAEALSGEPYTAPVKREWEF